MIAPGKTRPSIGTAEISAVDERTHVCVGAIAGAHGIRGEVKVKSFTSDPLDVGAYGPVLTDRGARLVLLPLRVQGQAVVARIEGVADRNAAEALRGRRLYVPRSALPATEDEDEFYHADLLGLAVVDGAGEVLGKVASIQDFGAGDMIEVAFEGGASAFLAFTREIVPVVDIAAGRLVAHPPEGWADTGADEPAPDETGEVS